MQALAREGLHSFSGSSTNLPLTAARQRVSLNFIGICFSRPDSVYNIFFYSHIQKIQIREVFFIKSFNMIHDI